MPGDTGIVDSREFDWRRHIALTPTQDSGTGFRRELRLLDATMLVIGSMIGSGIFIVSTDIARTVGGAGWLLLVWLFTGALTLMAALCYGELAGMMPRAGGPYVYLREAYSPLARSGHCAHGCPGIFHLASPSLITAPFDTEWVYGRSCGK